MTDNPVAEIIARTLMGAAKEAAIGEPWISGPDEDANVDTGEVFGTKLSLDGEFSCERFAHAIIAALEGDGYEINKKAPPPE